MRRTTLLVASIAFALASCAGEGEQTTHAGDAPPRSDASITSTSPSPTGHVELPIEAFRDIRYMAEPEGGKGTSLLDVYAPKGAGPWPVVVMCHGGGETKDGYEGWATEVAKRGAVVYVPTWSRMNNDRGAKISAWELREALRAGIGDIAAAVRFARGTAATYGGDPGNLTLFGHSYGGMGATMEAFSGIPAAESGLEGAGSTIPESLVIFDADYLLASFGDDMLARDPTLMHVFTPWDYLGRRVDFPITFLDAGSPELSRAVPDPWAEDSWLAVRDPSGDLRRGLEEFGALDDGEYGDTYLNGSGMKLLAERLRADGDTVTFITLTDSTHWDLGPKGMESLLDALVPEA